MAVVTLESKAVLNDVRLRNAYSRSDLHPCFGTKLSDLSERSWTLMLGRFSIANSAPTAARNRQITQLSLLRADDRLIAAGRNTPPSGAICE